ncbi:hypothetical protein C5167_012744 [Papaver somniferum]|uniref:non-specific serine/threonine protein kinase n=1 Tax=Papaver somniferum TaxID=3469 RepID=A0A4Y7IZ58_PAPSO|nr:hypothetical protein C5167_012744 [Papaver somniferum]
MKLDVDVLRYLSKDDFRVLTSVEMGMRNAWRNLQGVEDLLKHKLVHHDSSKYDGFRLTYLGYDFLAIKTLVNRGVFASIGRQIGVGKESDIYEVATEDGTILAMKLHRLGRVSFRAVKAKRDYLQHRSSYNWLYLSRLAALKEFAFMKALEENGFPVPNAVDCNRHCVIMGLVQGYSLVQVKEIQNPDIVFETIIGLVVRLAEVGLIHCDFNEFNIMIDDDEKVTMIDFPQMVSVNHRNAEMYFDRDVECIYKFFRRRFNLDEDENERPTFASMINPVDSLDKQLAASGFTKKDNEAIEKFIEGEMNEEINSDDEGCLPNDENDANVNNSDSLHLEDEEDNEDTPVQPGTEDPELKEDDEDDEDSPSEGDTEDPELLQRLNKQRRHAIKAAQGGSKKAVFSRNSYKDKGHKKSQSSKVLKKQMADW